MKGHPEVVDYLKFLLRGELAARDQYFIHSRRYEDFGLHAASQLGLPPDQVYKTLLVHQDKQVVTAVIPVSCMLSLKEVAKAAKLKKVEMMKPLDAERLTGYKVGGISPFAQKKQLPTLLDSRALQKETILVSGGRR